MNQPEPIAFAQVLDVPVHALTMEQALKQVESAIDERRRLRVGVVNAAKLVKMQSDPLLDTDVRSSDLVLADGMSVVWASRIGSTPLPERVAGIDLMHGIMQSGAGRGISVFFLGAKKAVCETVAEKALQDYPGLRIAGKRDGYFGETDEAEIVSQINDSGADVLFVAMSSPKKERFMGQWALHLKTPIIHGVGGSFDVYAGVVSRAPAWMQRSGLEWLHRVFQEPGRMWRRYLTTNLQFVWQVARRALRSGAAPLPRD